MAPKRLSSRVDLQDTSRSATEGLVGEKATEGQSLQEKSDEQLWPLLIGGNNASLVALYNRYFEILGNFGCQFTKNQTLIEDAIQDLFVDLNIKRKKLPEIKFSVKSFLIKSLKYKILQYLRNENKMIAAHRESIFFKFDYDFSIEHNIISRQILTEQEQLLKKATETLTARQREALYYYFNEQMRYEQIKDIMGLANIKSVRNLIYKSISRIRRYF